MAACPGISRRRIGASSHIRDAALDEPGTGNELRGPPAAHRAPRRAAEAPDPLPGRDGGGNRPVLLPRGMDLPDASHTPHRSAPRRFPAHLHRTHRGVPHLLQVGPVGRVSPGKPRDLLPDVAFRQPRTLPERKKDPLRLLLLVDGGPDRRDGVRILRRGPFYLQLLPRLRGNDHRSDAVDEGVPLADSADPFPLRGDVRDAAGPVSCGAGGNPLPESPAPREEGGGGRRVSPPGGSLPPFFPPPRPRRRPALCPLRGGHLPVRPRSKAEGKMKNRVERSLQIHYSRVGMMTEKDGEEEG